MGNTEVLNTSVASSFKGRTLSQNSVHVCINWSGRGSQQRGSKKLGRSWWDAPEGVEGADMIARLLSVLSEKSWWLRKVPDSWKKINIITSPSLQREEEDLGNYWSALLQCLEKSWSTSS